MDSVAMGKLYSDTKSGGLTKKGRRGQRHLLGKGKTSGPVSSGTGGVV